VPDGIGVGLLCLGVHILADGASLQVRLDL
jgi:hypothetical protein